MGMGRDRPTGYSSCKIYISFVIVIWDMCSYGIQGCQMAKFDPFLSLDCARVEGVGAQSKERKGSNFAA